MTYAAGLDAVKIIWIAQKFTEEHRAALDWLNDITSENIYFFGIEIELWKIGNSDPAPKFNLVAKPNDWTKAVHKSMSSQTLSPYQIRQKEYWQGLKNFVETNNSFLNCITPRPQHWYSFALGRSLVHMDAYSSERDGFIRVGLILDSKDSKKHFHIIKDNYQESFESYIEEEINWQELPDNKMSIISIEKKVNVKNRSEWPEQYKWLMEKLEKFDTFFRPKVKEL
jgi:hypothetical protein